MIANNKCNIDFNDVVRRYYLSGSLEETEEMVRSDADEIFRVGVCAACEIGSDAAYLIPEILKGLDKLSVGEKGLVLGLLMFPHELTKNHASSLQSLRDLRGPVAKKRIEHLEELLKSKGK